jgi:radical SAM superfamily enzyme YgiQ (UPF0313 family)
MKTVLILDQINEYETINRVGNGLFYIMNIFNSNYYNIKVIRDNFSNIKSIFKLQKHLTKYNYDIIAVSILAYYDWDLSLLFKTIRNRTKIVIVGGLGATIYYNDLLKYSNYWDYLFIGEGENSINMFLNNKDISTIPNVIYKKCGSIINNGIKSLTNVNDNIVFPYIEPVKKYLNCSENKGQIEAIFARGCIYSCSYCSNGKNRNTLLKNNVISNANEYRRRMNIEKIIEIMKYYISNGFTKIDISDDIFFDNIDWFDKFLEQYKRKIGNNIYSFYITLPYITKNFISILKKYDITITLLRFGVESGNEYLREKILNRPKYSNNDVHNILQMLNESKNVLNYRVNTMIGLPDETFEMMEETIKLLAENECCSFCTNIFTPIPNTEIFDYCVGRRYINKEFKNMANETISYLDKQVFNNDTLHKFIDNIECLSNKYLSNCSKHYEKNSMSTVALCENSSIDNIHNRYSDSLIVKEILDEQYN